MAQLASPGVAGRIQSLEAGTLVALYTLDLSTIGVDLVYSFTTQGDCAFAGVAYAGTDMQVTGFEMNGNGSIPQPELTVNNATLLLAGLCRTYDDLAGVRFVRRRTFSDYLDGGPQANPGELFAPDVYVFEQKTSHDKDAIVWKLSSSLDQQGVMFPGRTALRDVCPFVYRSFNSNTGLFDYSKALCPYNGDSYFDAQGNPTTAAQDTASYRLGTCCKKRFGANGILPIGAFPGLARVST